MTPKAGPAASSALTAPGHLTADGRYTVFCIAVTPDRKAGVISVFRSGWALWTETNGYDAFGNR